MLRPPRDVPRLLLGDERYHPDTSSWFDPVGSHARRTTTTAEYAWPEAHVRDGRLAFALLAPSLPSWITAGFFLTRQAARADGPVVGSVQVLLGEGRAEVTRRGRRIDVEIDASGPEAQVVRLDLGYDLSPAAGSEPLPSSTATYMIGLSR